MAKPMESVEINPFPNDIYRMVDETGTLLARIWFRPFDLFLACLVPTDEDKAKPFYYLLYCIVCTLVTLPICIILAPVGFLGTCMWFSMRNQRVPYRYSYLPSAENLPPQCSYSFSTANFCLLPIFMTKTQNINHPGWRARRIAKNLSNQQGELFPPLRGNAQAATSGTKDHSSRGGASVARAEFSDRAGVTDQDPTSQARAKLRKRVSKMQPSDAKSSSPNADATTDRQHQGNSCLSAARSTQDADGELQHGILTSFPRTDFFLIQETWDLQQSRHLAKQLHRVYPHVVYDAAKYNLKRMLGSGLMIASRYPFESLDFDRYEKFAYYGHILGKGCLHAKVRLGELSDGRNMVGYLHVTHMQSFALKMPVAAWQMTEALESITRFRERTQQQDDVVAFDILGGDFNADNLSPVHREEWHHPLFRTYLDVCRVSPGVDHQWTVGTDMCSATVNDDQVSTPEGLKMALEDPVLRQYHIIDGDVEEASWDMALELPKKDENGDWIVSPNGGRRRVDFLLPRADSNVVVRSCHFVTQLAGLTDHVGFNISIDIDPQVMQLTEQQ